MRRFEEYKNLWKSYDSRRELDILEEMPEIFRGIYMEGDIGMKTLLQFSIKDRIKGRDLSDHILSSYRNLEIDEYNIAERIEHIMPYDLIVYFIENYKKFVDPSYVLDELYNRSCSNYYYIFERINAQTNLMNIIEDAYYCDVKRLLFNLLGKGFEDFLKQRKDLKNSSVDSYTAVVRKRKFEMKHDIIMNMEWYYANYSNILTIARKMAEQVKGYDAVEEVLCNTYKHINMFLYHYIFANKRIVLHLPLVPAYDIYTSDVMNRKQFEKVMFILTSNHEIARSLCNHFYELLSASQLMDSLPLSYRIDVPVSRQQTMQYAVLLLGTRKMSLDEGIGMINRVFSSYQSEIDAINYLRINDAGESRQALLKYSKDIDGLDFDISIFESLIKPVVSVIPIITEIESDVKENEEVSKIMDYVAEIHKEGAKSYNILVEDIYENEVSSVCQEIYIDYSKRVPGPTIQCELDYDPIPPILKEKIITIKLETGSFKMPSYKDFAMKKANSDPNYNIYVLYKISRMKRKCVKVHDYYARFVISSVILGNSKVNVYLQFSKNKSYTKEGEDLGVFYEIVCLTYILDQGYAVTKILNYDDYYISK